jgi:ABC-type xylose transport system substrate-binding protein
VLATVALAAIGATSVASAQDKGTIGISMPTKSSRTGATRPTCSTPKTTSPISSRRSRT